MRKEAVKKHNDEICSVCNGKKFVYEPAEYTCKEEPLPDTVFLLLTDLTLLFFVEKIFLINIVYFFFVSIFVGNGELCKHQRIKRNAIYWTDKDNKYHWCKQDFESALLFVVRYRLHQRRLAFVSLPSTFLFLFDADFDSYISFIFCSFFFLLSLVISTHTHTSLEKYKQNKCRFGSNY